MRAAKFCERNLLFTEAKVAVERLERGFPEDVEVKIVDCFRRCLECRVKPFCRIQLTTIEAENADVLVEKVLEYIRD